MASVQRFLNIIALSMGLSGVLQLAGFVTPGWIRYNFMNDHSVCRGIWYPVGCHGETHESELHLDDKNYMKGYHPYRPLQVKTSFALAACVFDVVFLLKSRQYTGVIMVKRLAISAYISLLSGMLSLEPAATTAVSQFFYTGEYAEYLFPYSALLTGLGGVLALVVSLISLHRIRSNQTTYESSLPLPSAENQESNTTLL